MKKRKIIGSIISVFSCLSLFTAFPTQNYATEDLTALVPSHLFNQKSGLVNPDSFKLGLDEYITGMLDKKIKKVVLYVNDQQIESGKIFSDQTFEIHTGNKITSLKDKVEVVGLDRKGNELERQTVSIEQAKIVLTAEDYALHDDTIQGIAGNQMEIVSLIINDEFIRSVNIEENDQFTIPIENGDIFDDEDIVEVVGSLNNKELARIIIPVNPVNLHAEIQPFNFRKDSNITGRLSGKIVSKVKTVQLYVNRKRHNKISINDDGTFSLVTTRKITNLNDDVKIAVLDTNGNELARYQVLVQDGESKPLTEWFEHPKMAISVGKAINKHATDIASKQELETITSLKLMTHKLDPINNLKGIENLTNLKALDTENLKIGDLSPLTELKKLESLNNIELDSFTQLENIGTIKTLKSLNLSGTKYYHHDISPIAELTNLEYLDISFLLNTKISNFSTFKSLSNLKNLVIFASNINSLEFLHDLTQLKSLSVYATKTIDDISCLSNLTALTSLNLSGNIISDISSLSNLTALTSLDLSGNIINDISSLSNLTALTYLNLSNNNINDASCLSNFTALTNLDLSNSNIKDFSGLSNLTALTKLNLRGNQIQDSITLDTLKNLKILELDNNELSDLKFVQNLDSLKELYVGHNKIKDISPLANMEKLEVLYLNNNNIQNIQPLKKLRHFYVANQTIIIDSKSISEDQTVLVDFKLFTPEEELILPTHISDNGIITETNNLLWSDLSNQNELNYSFRWTDPNRKAPHLEGVQHAGTSFNGKVIIPIKK